MNSGITKQALLRHRWSLAGPAATQVVGACVISVMLMIIGSIASLSVAERHLPSVASANEFVHIFYGNARFLSLIVVGVTMTLAMSQQMQDIALLRSIGATPKQVRWCLVRQAVIISVPASLVGFLLAIPVGSIWLELLQHANVLPGATSFHVDASALLGALKVEVVASLIGTFVAVARPSAKPPASALTDATSARKPIGRSRMITGITLIAGGIVLSIVLSQLSADAADAAGIFILLGECVGVGLLGPFVLHRVTKLALPWAGNGHGRIALDELNAMSRSLSGALIPLVLSISFAAIQNSMLATASHATGVADTTNRLMTFSGTTSTAAFAAVAAINCLITVMVGSKRELATMTLIGASRQALLRIRWIETFIFTGTAVAIAAGISFVTLIPIVTTAYSTWLPYLPPAGVIIGLCGVIALTATGIVGSSSMLLKRHPISVLRVDA